MVKAREKRVPIMMSEEEMKAIDDWRFENRIATRSDAIRRLCKTSLESEPAVTKSALTALNLSRHIGDSLNEFHRVERSDLTFEEFKKNMVALLAGLHFDAQRTMSEIGVVFAIFNAFRRPGETQQIMETLGPMVANLKEQDSAPGNQEYDALFQALSNSDPDG